MMRRPFGTAVLALFLLSPTLAAQEKTPPPQEFDWYEEAGIPAVSPWGQALDTAYAREILSWTTTPWSGMPS